MHLFDKKFINHKRHYILQTLLAALFAFGVLIALGGYKHAEILGIVGFTSLGSSAFIAFGTYNVVTASTRSLIGGYFISVLAGICCWKIAHDLGGVYPELTHYYLYELFAAIAIAIAMFFMTVLDVEHPPAAGLALGMVVEDWSWHVLVIILIAVLILVIVRKLLKPYLISLI